METYTVTNTTYNRGRWVIVVFFLVLTAVLMSFVFWLIQDGQISFSTPLEQAAVLMLFVTCFFPLVLVRLLFLPTMVGITIESDAFIFLRDKGPEVRVPFSDVVKIDQTLSVQRGGKNQPGDSLLVTYRTPAGERRIGARGQTWVLGDQKQIVTGKDLRKRMESVLKQ